MSEKMFTEIPDTLEGISSFEVILKFMRLLRQTLEKHPELLRASLSAVSLYDLILEQVDTLRFFVKEPHWRQGPENPEIIFDLEKADVLGNPSSYRIRKKASIVAPAPSELTGLFNIEKALILLKKNRSLSTKVPLISQLVDLQDLPIWSGEEYDRVNAKRDGHESQERLRRLRKRRQKRRQILSSQRHKPKPGKKHYENEFVAAIWRRKGD